MTTETAHVRTSRLRRLANAIFIATLALVVVGAIVRLSVRDSFMLTGLIFYVTPPAIMVLLLSLAVVFPGIEFVRTRRLAVGLLSVSVFWMATTQWVSNGPTASVPTQPTHRLMFWNVCEGRFGWDKVFATIDEQNPDIIALAEAETLKDQDADFFRSHFPGYQRLDFPRRLVLLSRLPIRSNRRIGWVPGCVVEATEIETERGVLTLVFSDVASAIFSHRQPQIEALTDAVSKLSGPVIIVGDLNTPVDSLFFDHLRKNYVNAFETRGNGLHTTWPMPVPVMAIDHMWGNNSISFQTVRILWTTASDHRPLISDFSIVLPSE